MINYYHILDISQSASTSEIEAQFKSITAKILSDKKYTKAMAEAKMDELSEALEVLVDPESRREYDEQLEAGEGAQFHSLRQSTFDFASYRNQAKIEWMELLDGIDLNNPYLVLKSIFDKILYLPNGELQQKFAIAGLMTPSALSDTLPLIFCHGHEGTGKSILGKIAAKLWGVTPLNAAATYVGIRNKINKHRYLERDGRKYEQNFVLVWNDIKPENLRDKNLISLLKSGYNRDESIIEISSQDKNGDNSIFDVFCTKIFSSVSPIFTYPEYAEITRRMLIFTFAKADFDLNLISLKEISFKGFYEISKNFWENEINVKKFVESRKSIRKEFRKYGIAIDRCDIAESVLQAGLTMEIWETAKEAVHDFWQWEQYQEFYKDCNGDRLKICLRNYLESYKEIKKISTLQVKNYVNGSFATNILEEKPKPSDVNKIIESLGWTYNHANYHWEYKKDV